MPARGGIGDDEGDAVAPLALLVVHGYDLKGDVAPAKPAVIDFTANVPGVFEVELEESGLKLLELQVQ